MIYIFDKTQAIIKVLTNDDFTAAHLNLKINTATTFEFSLPASKALPSGSKYVATPHPLNDSKFIMLRLTERTDNTETIDYSAYELAYQELATDGYIEDKRPAETDAKTLMQIALNGTNWELNNVNVAGTAKTNFYYIDHLSAISNVVDLLGGEIVFYIEIQGNAISGRYMDYLARQGADTSKVFSSGSNLLTVERQSDTSNIYTAILPRGKGKEIDNGDANTPDGYGRRINIADVEWKKSAGNPLDKPKGSIVLSDPDATSEWGQINGNARLLLQTYDDIDDVNVLINSAYKTLQSVNHPQIQYSATVADVGGLSLGDTVLIMHGDRDLSYKTRVFEVKYDLLSPDQTELSLGDDLSSNSITSQINNLNAVADTTSSQTQWTINQIGRPGTTYGETAPDSPKVGDVWFKYLADGGTKIYRWNGDIWELLASPTTADDIATAVNDAVAQANAHTDEVKQGLSSDIDTAKSQAASQASAAEANAKSAATSQFTQAQSALSAAKTDLTNSIASEASARNQAVAAANSQAQTYANQAKADALNAVNKEASDRQNAVSALDTKATNAVNQAKNDINDTIKAISVGGRNLILNSKTLPWNTGWNTATTSAKVSYDDSTNMWHITAPKGGSGNAGIFFGMAANSSRAIAKGEKWAFSFDIKGTGVYSQFGIEASSPVNIPSDNVPTDWTRVSSTGVSNGSNIIILYFNSINTALDVYVKLPKLETGNKATDYSQAPEDVVLDYTTKDNQIKATITQYQTTNDGKVTKAQTDATTALGQVTTKVSQTDYDTKTGDLTTKYTQVKQTADSQAEDIVDIKATATSQASKINSISSDVDGTKQSISGIETTQDSQSDKINQITTDVNGTKQSITDIQTKDGQQDTRMGTIETSVSGVKSDFSSYKTTNDGAVKTAQTTAQTAVDGLKTKVSQTDYNTKTGQLQTDLTATTQTANQAKTDIVSIKQKDGEQDAKMNTIVSDANGTKQTVSDLQTTQGKQTGDISTLQQRANGFDATVTKVNNLSVGGRNYLVNSTSILGLLLDNSAIGHNGSQGVVYDYIPTNAKEIWSYSSWSDKEYSVTSEGKYLRYGLYDINKNQIMRKAIGLGMSPGTSKGQIVVDDNSNVAYIRLSIDWIANGYGRAKFEKGTLTTDWTPAPEDVDSATAKAQLTADNATLSINNYKTDADGRISKAQADIVTNANAITQKVSQNDYDKKTGDLTTAVSRAQQTADGAVSTVGNYKTSNDSRVSSAESKIEQNSNAITQKVSQTDYNNNNSQLNTRFTKVEATANGASTAVGELNTTVNNLGQINQLFNTEFSPDFAGWYTSTNANPTDVVTTQLTPVGTDGFGSNVVSHKGVGNWINSAPISVTAGMVLSFSSRLSVPKTVTIGTPIALYIMAYDATNARVLSQGYNIPINQLTATPTTFKIENIVMPSGAVKAFAIYAWNVSDEVYISQPMLVFASTVGTYVQGNYNNNAALAQVKIAADSISNFVRDSSGNISSDFQTALSKTSIITGSTLATSIQKQTATQITSALTDNNGKIISLINQDTSGVQIAGKNIVLDGNTTVTGDFYAKGGNFKNLNASNLTVGTLNGNQVNITNINANNIVSGAISGANLNINLNTGSVVFQKGRINSSDYTTDINIDKGYISTADGDTRALLTQGKLQLIDPTFFSPQTNPYLEISNNSNVFNGMSALIKARDSLTVSINGYDDRGYGDPPTYTETFVGLSIGKNGSGLMPTKIGGAEQGVIISGGVQYSDSTVNLSKFPYIYVGSDSRGISPNGNRIYINGSYVHSPSTYNRTTSASANVVVNADGALVRSSSARKYKLDIKNNIPIADSLKLIDVPLSTWVDKHEHEENGSNERYFGMIAEDLRDAGLEYLVQYGEGNEVEGINYDRVALLLIPLVKKLKERIEKLERTGK